MLVHAFVLSKIDYCNAVLFGITKQQLTRVQSVLNAAARLLLRIPKFGHISAGIRDELHWLPVEQRVLYKVIVLVWNCVTGTGPSYLRELCISKSNSSGRSLRSDDKYFLKETFSKNATKQKRAFSVVGPAIWNKLPLELRLLQLNHGSTALFKNNLKTHLFPKPES